MGMPSLSRDGVGNPLLGMRTPSSTSALEARVVALPLPCFYQLERTTHATNCGMPDAELARCISESLAGLGVDFVLKAEKAKWKVRCSRLLYTVCLLNRFFCLLALTAFSVSTGYRLRPWCTF